jgi:hypothetical protein
MFDSVMSDLQKKVEEKSKTNSEVNSPNIEEEGKNG